jgi:hypothetical protein
MKYHAESEHGRLFALSAMRHLTNKQKDSPWNQFDLLMFVARSQTQDLDPEPRVLLVHHQLLAADREAFVQPLDRCSAAFCRSHVSPSLYFGCRGLAALVFSLHIVGSTILG